MLGIIIISRALYDTSLSATPEQFAYLAEAVNYVSDVQAQTHHQVRALINKDRIKDCRDHEEDEGRINCDMLHRFIIVGGSFVAAGLNMQDQLVRNVS